MESRQITAEELAKFRIKGKGSINYWNMELRTGEILERRSYMRRILKDTPFANKSNDELDGMRIWPERFNGGYFVEDEKGYEFLLPSKKITEEETGFRRERAMMPVEFMNLMGKDFKWDKYDKDTESQREMVNNFITKYKSLSEKGMGLYIFSRTKGSGKTMLSCCILNELSKRYIGSVKFVNALDLLEMTKKGYRQEETDVESLHMCRVLVIDDIGVQLDGEWVNTVFYRLINERYGSRKVTIYTSNIAIHDLKMDDRIIDRIESTSFELHLPEVPLRSIMRKEEKDKLMKNAP